MPREQSIEVSISDFIRQDPAGRPTYRTTSNTRKREMTLQEYNKLVYEYNKKTKQFEKDAEHFESQFSSFLEGDIVIVRNRAGDVMERASQEKWERYEKERQALLKKQTLLQQQGSGLEKTSKVMEQRFVKEDYARLLKEHEKTIPFTQRVKERVSGNYIRPSYEKLKETEGRLARGEAVPKKEWVDPVSKWAEQTWTRVSPPEGTYEKGGRFGMLQTAEMGLFVPAKGVSSIPRVFKRWKKTKTTTDKGKTKISNIAGDNSYIKYFRRDITKVQSQKQLELLGRKFAWKDYGTPSKFKTTTTSKVFKGGDIYSKSITTQITKPQPTFMSTRFRYTPQRDYGPVRMQDRTTRFYGQSVATEKGSVAFGQVETMRGGRVLKTGEQVAYYTEKATPYKTLFKAESPTGLAEAKAVYNPSLKNPYEFYYTPVTYTSKTKLATSELFPKTGVVKSGGKFKPEGPLGGELSTVQTRKLNLKDFKDYGIETIEKGKLLGGEGAKSSKMPKEKFPKGDLYYDLMSPVKPSSPPSPKPTSPKLKVQGTGKEYVEYGMMEGSVGQIPSADSTLKQLNNKLSQFNQQQNLGSGFKPAFKDMQGSGLSSGYKSGLSSDLNLLQSKDLKELSKLGMGQGPKSGQGYKEGLKEKQKLKQMSKSKLKQMQLLMPLGPRAFSPIKFTPKKQPPLKPFKFAFPMGSGKKKRQLQSSLSKKKKKGIKNFYRPSLTGVAEYQSGFKRQMQKGKVFTGFEIRPVGPNVYNKKKRRRTKK